MPGTEGPSLPPDTLTSPGTHVPTPDTPPGAVPVTRTGPVIDPHAWSVVILATPDRYTPLMSSTVGIRLDAGYNATVPVFYAWGTDYGHFVSWNTTDREVTTHDRYVETHGPSVFWTYSPEDMGKEKPPAPSFSQ